MKHTRTKGWIVSAICILFTTAISAQDNHKTSANYDLKSNLPIIIIETTNEINAESKVDASMKIIFDKKKKMFSSNETSYHYNGPIRIKLRGNSSLSFNQKKYTIETRNSDGTKNNVSLFGMPADNDWVLLAPYNDISMMRDALAFKLWEEMGYWAPRTQMVEVIVNGDYRGVYTFTEKIKDAPGRVDISSGSKNNGQADKSKDGFLLRIDTYDEENTTFKSKIPGIGWRLFNTDVIWTCLYPSKKNITRDQLNYIQGFVDQMEQCIQSPQFNDKDNGYNKYIKVSSFIDYFIHTELSLNADAYKRSAYFFKEKQNEDGTGGKILAGPVWDYNLAFGNCNFCGADDVNSWAYEGCNTSPTPAFWKRLLQDAEYLKQLKTRYWELRKTILSDKHIFALIDGYASQLSEPQKRQFKKYEELLQSEKDKDKPQNGFMMGMPQGGFFPGGFPMMGMPMMGVPNGMGGIPNGNMTNGNMTNGNMPNGSNGNAPTANMPNGNNGNNGNVPNGNNGNNGIPNGANMPQFPMMGGMPNGMGNMPNGMAAMPNGFGGMPNMMMMNGGGQISWFAAYRVSSYEEEIKYLKNWIHDRLEVMDEAFKE